MALLHHCLLNFKPIIAVSRESSAPKIGQKCKRKMHCCSIFYNESKLSYDLQRQLELSELLLDQAQEDSLKGLVLIDTMQRFGIDHYFEDQITQTLNQQYQRSHQTLLCNSDDDRLYAVSLRFRLLRQQGFHVPADVFNSFKGENIKFKDALSEDVRGLMALHEASHLCLEDEDILDEAFIFTTNFLTARLPHLDARHASLVQTTLQYPHHKTLARFMAKNYLQNHALQNDWEKHLADLAIMDFNVSQNTYHQEIIQVLKWWKEIGLWEELKLARNQPLKWYIWSMAMGNDPRLSKQRIEIMKPITLVYVVDDIFDVYGTLHQLTLFTEAINRWEFSVTDKLPSYMKMCFKVIHDTTHEISNIVYQEFGWNPIDYLKKEWASLCDAFLTEAKWFASGHSPKADEYLQNGIITSGVPMLLTNHFFLMGYGDESTGTKEIEGIISSVAAILRLLDDLGTAKDEEQEGKDGSYMKYYMKEQQGSRSLSDGRQHVMEMVSQQWKLLNKHCLSPTTIPTSFKTDCLNVARLVPMMYTYNHNHRLPVLEELVKSMFSNLKEDLVG